MDNKPGITDSTESVADRPSKGDSQEDVCTSQATVKSSDSMVRIVCDFSDVVVIRVKSIHFKIPRNILTTTSLFFDEELNHSTPPRFFLAVDDVDAALFNTYVNVLLKSACSPGFRIRRCNGHPNGSWITNLEFLLRLWQLGKRFNSFIMCLLAEEALTSQYFAKFTAEKWQVACLKSGGAHVHQILLALQQNYMFCKDEAIPFDGEMVAACAKFPGLMVAKYLDQLDPDFRTELSKVMAPRKADSCKAAKRKRVPDDGGEPEAVKKIRP